MHNIFITPDESEVIAGLRGDVEPGEPAFQIIDPKTDTVAWGMELTGHTQYGKTHHEVRPMAFEADADGSTKRAYAQATGINVVFVIDWKARKVVQTAHAAEAAALETECGRHPDRRHARTRGAARSIVGVGIEPP